VDLHHLLAQAHCLDVEIIAEWVTLKNSINSITYQDPIED
jgi:hypothetical protein